jgi:xanthine dehydrogenase accessory factor
MPLRAAQRSAALARTWLRGGQRIAVALLAEVEGSAPLAPGALLFATAEGHVEGSITGGCVEADAVRRGLAQLAAGGGPAELVRYGTADAADPLATTGLMCGGTVAVLIGTAGPDDTALLRHLTARAHGTPSACATILTGPHAGGRVTLDADGVATATSGAPRALVEHVVADLGAALVAGRGALRAYGADGARLGGDVRVLLDVHAPPPQIVAVGAVDFSAALATLAAALGYAVTVCDPRSAFLDSPRFATTGARRDARWPDAAIAAADLGPQDAVVVFSHDPKLDVPACRAALASAAGYVGALGSRRTAADRADRLAAAGVTPDQLRRLHAPCGLDIGGATPEETALSVLAEVVAARHGRAAGPLREATGPIRALALAHHDQGHAVDA